MLLQPCAVSEMAMPEWFADALGITLPGEGESFEIDGRPFVMQGGLPRSHAFLSESQAQTEETFGFKWKMRDAFDSPASLARMREWLIERYGDVAHAPWLALHGESPLLLDAGCGAGMSGLELLGEMLPHIRYLGVDVSEAVNIARTRFAERGFHCAFMQADICDLPLAPGSVDLIFSEGVLHHTNSTEKALKGLAHLLKPGGHFLFYVYRRKGPIREFTDDYVRAKLQNMSPEEAWSAMKPLTNLGIAMGNLDVEIDIPEAIEILGIPAGRINLQRFFYWHVAKAFFRPDLTFEEMNHINFDWYAPANAYRQSPEDVRTWCAEANLEIEREVVEEAGITIIARKKG